MNTKLIRLADVLNKTGLSKSTIARLEEANVFPKRRKIGSRVAVWIEAEVDDWINQIALVNHKAVKVTNG